MALYTKTSVNIVTRRNFAFSLVNGVEPAPAVVTAVVGGTLQGNTNPYWRTQIRTHQDATTDMLASRNEVSDTVGRFQAIRKSKATGLDDRWLIFKGGPYGGPAEAPLLGFVSSSLADNRAAGDFYSAARSKMSTFKGSVFAAESRQAKKMIVDRSKRILGSIDPYQRRLKKRWYGKGSKRSRLKLLSDSWLELQFGWKPLFSDIEDAIKALNNPRPQFSRVFGESTDYQPVSRVETPFSTGIGAMLVTTTEHTVAHVKYYGEVRAYAEPSGAGPKQDFGLTAREFLPTLWEVIPWSFAIDYFTNCSDIVNAISYAGCNFTWRAKVVTTSRERVKDGVCFTGPSNATHDYRVVDDLPFRSSAKVTSISRSKNIIVPIPALRWELPSRMQALNLAALAVSRRLRLFHV